MNQALRMLEGRGLVEVRTGPGGGVFAARPTDRLLVANMALGFRHGTVTVEECLAVRDALEPVVASTAANYRTDEDLAEMKELLARMEAVLDDSERYLRYNWRLHARIAQSSRNRVLSMVYSALVEFLDAELVEAASASDALAKRSENLHTHARLVDAIEAGEAALAASLASHHAPMVSRARTNPSDSAFDDIAVETASCADLRGA